MNIEAKLRFAQIVRTTRGNLSQREFAKRLGISLGTLQGWEEGRSTPTTANLSKVAVLAGYSLEELISNLNGEPLPHPSELEQMVRKIRSLSLHEAAVIARAATERLATIAEEK